MRTKRVEPLDIPSNSESADGLCDSDDEEDASANKRPSVNLLVNDDNSIDEKVLQEDTPVLSPEKDNVWQLVSLPRSDAPFTKEFGPNIPENVASPMDIFSCLFPPHLVDLIVEQTNLYAEQKQNQQNPVTREEILIFLGINILMSVKKLPYYYWCSNPQLHDSFAPLMPVNRFGFLLSHLHLSDQSAEPKKGDHNYDKLYKLRPLLDELSRTFKSCWRPGKYQSVDETMIKFKGRSSMKQYMPAKPMKRGYKSWTRADESGYVCEFQLYTGKTDSVEKQLGSRVVKDLTRELVGGNHYVYFDNFFTSVELLSSLKRDQIFACGTVRSNRSGLPKSQKKPDKSMKVGDFEFQTSSTDLRWIKWMDKRAVHFLSNYHDPSEKQPWSADKRTDLYYLSKALLFAQIITTIWDT